MSECSVIPAIELRGGMALKYESVGMGTRANRVEPIGLARQFVEAGAPMIQVFNLDGPFIVSGVEHSGSVLAGAERNLTVMAEMARSLPVPVQVSGGVRDIESFRQVIELGIPRVCIGSAAMRDPEFVKKAVEHNPNAVVVFIDVRGGRAVSQDWIPEPSVTPLQLASALKDAGVSRFIYQDVDAAAGDGGPHVEGAGEYEAEELIVAGGVKTLDHVRRVVSLGGVTGVIVGKPLTLGEFTYAQAAEAARRP